DGRRLLSDEFRWKSEVELGKPQGSSLLILSLIFEPSISGLPSAPTRPSPEPSPHSRSTTGPDPDIRRCEGTTGGGRLPEPRRFSGARRCRGRCARPRGLRHDARESPRTRNRAPAWRSP